MENISLNSHSSQLRTSDMGARPAPQQGKTVEQKQPQPVAEKKVTEQQVREVVQSFNDFVQPIQSSLKFEFHDKLGEYYVTVRDDITNEVIQEIPSKKLLDIYATMAEQLGFLVDRKI